MRVLLVEDDTDLRDGLRASLTRDDIIVNTASDGVHALNLTMEYDFDVVILDRDLPLMSGDSVCREMRTNGQPTPVLMLTALSEIRDRVAGLDMGADDYLPKPFAYEELLARVHALARRPPPRENRELQHGNLTLDPERGTVTFNDQRIRLSPKELRVLEALLRADGRPLSVDRLLDSTWDTPDTISRSVVKVVIHSLRQKLDPSLIVHEPGYGYRL